MNRSFAHIPRTLQARRLLFVASITWLLSACASLPPPTDELANAQQAVTRAADADADQYAGDAIGQARNELAQAQSALGRGRDNDARALALQASADAEFALASSNAAKTSAQYAQQRGEIIDLQQRLQLSGEDPAPSPLEIQTPSAAAAGDATVLVGPASRLQALETDPRLNGFAAYERLRAHQAVDAVAVAHSRERDNAVRIADRRVAIAELAARTEATRRQIDELQRERSELLVQSSRREAEQARQEAERLRVQAQMQAEETQRLREQADADASARQQAEDVIVDVGAQEAAKLKAARDKEAALARQEAELMVDGKAAAADGKTSQKRKSKKKK